VGPFVGALADEAVGAIAGFACAYLLRFITHGVAVRHAAAGLGIKTRISGTLSMPELFARFALPGSLTGLIGTGSIWFGSFLLVGQIDGPHYMGLFAAALNFRLLVLFLPIQIATIGVPMLTRHLAAGEHSRFATLLRAGTLITAAIAAGLALVLGLLAPQVLRIFGPGFTEAQTLARLLLAGAVAEAIAGAMYQALPSRGLMWRSFLIVALPRDTTLLITSLIFVPRWRAFGLASALVLSQCVGLAGCDCREAIPGANTISNRTLKFRGQPWASSRIPVPNRAVMKLDRAAWAQELHLSNFVNSYYQYRDVQSLPNVRRLLVVGPGQGLDTAVFRWRGYEVVTFDIDATFHPDVIGSVHEMKMFAEQEFDVVVASHVVEHLPVAYLDDALRELARVARFCAHLCAKYRPPDGFEFLAGFRGLRWSFVVDVYNWFRGPDPNRPIFAAGDHYWEVGRRGFSRRSLARRLRSHFRILKQYRNRDWLLSVNFVLQSMRSGK